MSGNNDRFRPSYRALVEALADEFTTVELTQIADALHEYDEDVGAGQAQLTLMAAVQDVIDRP